MSKKKDQKRRGQLESRAKLETLKFQIEYSRKQLMPELTADDPRLVAELEAVQSNGLVNDLLELQTVFEGIRRDTGLKSIADKCNIRGAILPYLLGITCQNPVEAGWTDDSLSALAPDFVRWHIQLTYTTDDRIAVVNWLKAHYNSLDIMTTLMGQPLLKLKKIMVEFRRERDN